MDIRKLQRAIVDGLEDVKAHDIRVFNTEHLSPLFERVIVASGTSNRQTKALASSVRDAVKSRGLQVIRMEGEDNGEWIIVDCGAAVVHVMQPAIRQYYNLEELWGDKPVHMKVADGQQAALPKAGSTRAGASASKPTSARAAPARGTVAASAAKPPAKKAAAKKTAVQKAPAKPAAAKKSAPRRSAPRTPTATPAKSAAGSVRGPARRAPAKKAPPRKA
jgi:ribosome-associated protein